MSNKVENNGINNSSARICYDQNNIKGEMMRYRANSLSYKLGMIAILFSLFGAFICLNSFKWDVSVIIKILGNIAILLFGFLSIEKAKAYSKTYSLVLMGIGGVCVLRIFWIPLKLIYWWGQLQAGNSEAANFFSQAVIGDPKKNSYLPQSGVIRGYMAIALIAVAAVAFIASGLIGYKKAKEYADYMKDQDVSKGV